MARKGIFGVSLYTKGKPKKTSQGKPPKKLPKAT